MKSLTRPFLALVISGLCLATASAVVTMGFETDTADHFIWNSGRLLPNDTVTEFGTFWTLGADSLIQGPAVRILPVPNPASAETNLTVSDGMLPLSGDGIFDELIDGIDFYSISATYHDAVPGEDIGNVRVEGWLKNPNAVPEGSSTLPLLAMGLLGFLGKTRRRER